MKGQAAAVRVGILRALEEAGRPMGAAALAERLEASEAQPRTVRYHLLRLDREGLTRFVSRRKGREISDLGREELGRAGASRRVGMVAARIDALSFAMAFRADEGCGTVIANSATIHQSQLMRSMEDMKPVFSRQLGMGGRIIVAREGETLAGLTVPRDHVALGTVCSVTLNGILLREGVPVHARFGGLVEIRDGRPVRFVELIAYSGTSLDPMEFFIKAGLTRVRDGARSGNGILGASFREVPSAALDRVLQGKDTLARHSLGGLLAVGRPGRPLLDIPVAEGRVGLVVAAGLNPIAAIHETGAPIALRSLAGLEDYARFRSFQEWRDRLPR